MQDSSKFAVGIDVGTTTVRAVVARIDSEDGTPTIVGIGQAPNSGMRKGVVVNLQGPSKAIDTALAEAERVSGYRIDTATFSINGQHILTSHADGMIAVGTVGHEITQDDLERLKEVAVVGKIPANREVLDIIPHAYTLDDQANIKDPLGMTGTRLEVTAHIVSALAPHLANLQKAAEEGNVAPRSIVASVVAAGDAVLTEKQLENGVAVVDMGGATTGVAVYEEGDLQYVGVVPIGGMHITNDLAIGLKTDVEVAEKVKIEHGSAIKRGDNAGVSVKYEDEIYSFETSDIDDIIEARLEEIFEGVQKELKRAGRAGKLPAGIVLTGGSVQLKGVAEYAKEALGLATKIANLSTYQGVTDDVHNPAFATVIGLVLIDADDKQVGYHDTAGKKPGMLSKLFGRFNK